MVVPPSTPLAAARLRIDRQLFSFPVIFVSLDEHPTKTAVPITSSKGECNGPLCRVYLIPPFPRENSTGATVCPWPYVLSDRVGTRSFFNDIFRGSPLSSKIPYFYSTDLLLQSLRSTRQPDQASSTDTVPFPSSTPLFLHPPSNYLPVAHHLFLSKNLSLGGIRCILICGTPAPYHTTRATLRQVVYFSFVSAFPTCSSLSPASILEAASTTCFSELSHT